MSLGTGYYNFYFDICAIAFNIVFLLLISGRKIVVGRRYKYFYYLVLVMLLASLGELCTSLIRDGLWQVSNGAKVAINVLSSFFHNSIGFLLYMYVLHIFGIFRHLTMRIRIMISIPEAVLTILSFIPAFIGFWLGTLFLLLLDHVTPHLHMFAQNSEGPHTKLKCQKENTPI